MKKEAETQLTIQEKDEEVAPIFSFLTSSLNVELVYIILESITQFSFINSDQSSKVTSTKKTVNLLDPDAEDATIRL